MSIYAFIINENVKIFIIYRGLISFYVGFISNGTNCARRRLINVRTAEEYLLRHILLYFYARVITALHCIAMQCSSLFPEIVLECVRAYFFQPHEQ